MKKILIIEDDLIFSKILEKYLRKYDYETVTASQLKDAYAINHEDYDLILLDFNLPDGTGFDFLNYKKEKRIETPVVIMTSYHDIKTAVNCMKIGAVDYITKPINQEELLSIINEQIKTPSSIPVQQTSVVTDFVQGKSKISEDLYKNTALVANTDMSVLILGESGTGKEHVAQMIHQLSSRKDKKFVAVDCGALSNDLAGSELFGHKKGAFTGALQDKIGQFQLANGGTIFLDEIGNLNYEIQIKLLRVLQERIITPVGSTEEIPIDIRLIAATNEHLFNASNEGKFREDLYHRINEFSIKVPPLKDRKEDISDFIDYFIKQSNFSLHKNVKGINDDVHKLFISYSWPGNIRELKNVIKRAVLLCDNDYISKQHLPDEMEDAIVMNHHNENVTNLKDGQEKLEKDLILKTLKATNFNKSKTAKILKIDRTTLYNKLAKYNIE